ncbi:hypothetical protein EXVG_00017 [Emiliania huxleyi virus 202]|nr:hypothetical protein EXVG_00017 [Emiliania huxleyi virus 202]AHA54537.1 hypothetical protein EhV18_00491 [Emiliania huxleyi virus 18]AHA55576.1 hypothetical protein EhV156_00481 [Emiliania huxleyi virus 156]
MEIPAQRNERSYIYMFYVITWNIICPLVYRHCVNFYAIPRINTYLSEYTVLTIVPPEIEPLSIPSAYMLVFLKSVKFII